MVFLKHILLGAIFLVGPAYALESSELVTQEKGVVEQQENVDEADKANLHKNVHHKHLSKRPYKGNVAPNNQAKKAEKGSPHKNIYNKHTSKRPHSDNVSH